jgi:hypothetical protein
MIPTRFRSKDYLGAAPNEPMILQIVDRSGVRTRQWRHAISIGSRSIASRPPFYGIGVAGLLARQRAPSRRSQLRRRTDAG